MAGISAVPQGWGTDLLSQFMEGAKKNTLATYANLRPVYDLLEGIDQVYRTLIENLTNAREWFSTFFVLRSHSSYLGGVRLSMSGQIAESYMVLRGCIESALYGLYVSRDHKKVEIWLGRHDDEATKETMKREFQIVKIMKSLESVDKRIHTVTKKLYERTIDYGAHPNERGLMSLVRQTKEEKSIHFSLDYLTANNLPFRLCLKSTAQVGVCSLEIIRNIYPERFDILGISEKISQLKKGL
jgi:hypothetical protein